jgi:hypothetical protein
MRNAQWRSVSFIGIPSLLICLFALKCKLSSQLGMLLYAKWFHRENNASHAELVSGSKNGCSFIFDKKYDELRCAPL